MFVTAEVRWFYQDECPANLHRWFGETSPAPGGGKLRVDEYLSQTNQSEMSAKIRGERSGLEIKGLVAACRSEAVPFAPYVELWCKWSLQASALEITKKMIVQKTRWLRTYDTSQADIVEIPLRADEKALNGQPLPRRGCNVEITKVQLAEDPRQWRTLGFEAFGDLDSAPRSLQTTAQFLIARSIPLPNSCEFMNYPAWLDKIMTSEMPRRFGRPRRKGHNLSGMIFTPSCYEKIGNKSGSIPPGPERKQDCSRGQVPWRT